MKTFIEEYGLIVVAAIVIMIFVLVATPVGTVLKDGVKSIQEKYTENLQDGLNGKDDDNDKGLENKVIYTLGDSITYLNGSWAFQLAEKSGAKKVINIARGGAVWKDRGSLQTDYDENSPLWSLDIVATTSADGKTISFNSNSDLTNGNLPSDNTNYTTISNEIRFMERLISEGYESPDIIVVACGINDTSKYTLEYSEETFNGVFATSFEDMTITDRSNIGGGLRWCIEKLRTLYPNALLIVGNPIQTAYGYLRPYLPNTLAWMDTMCRHYSVPIINAHDESGILKEYENGWDDLSYVKTNSGRYLYDGLHPNSEGQILMGNFYAREIAKIYYSLD